MTDQIKSTIQSASATKKEYQDKVKAELDKLNARLAEMKAKLDGAQADARVQYHTTIEELEAKRDALDVKLQELQKAGEEAWQELQKGVDNAWQSLNDAFNQAVAKFK